MRGVEKNWYNNLLTLIIIDKNEILYIKMNETIQNISIDLNKKKKLQINSQWMNNRMWQFGSHIRYNNYVKCKWYDPLDWWQSA